MADKTPIEWTDATWNVTTGCHKVSPGCKHCAAEREWKRLSANPKSVCYGRAFTDVRTHPERLVWPLKWARSRMIFVDFMGDLFHKDVPDDFIAEVFGVMAVCGAYERGEKSETGRFGFKWNAKQKRWYGGKGPHTFQILTKQPQRMLELLTSPRFRQAIASAAYRRAMNQRDAGYLAHQIGNKPEYSRCYEHGRMWPLQNVWLGVSAEDQERADERIPLLLRTPAAVRFISAEPLLGPIDIVPYVQIGRRVNGAVRPDLGWVIAGGESGPKARPSHPDWIRSLRDQCAAAGVKFFFKQWGEWLPINQAPEALVNGLYRSNKIAKSHQDQGALDECYGRRCTVPQAVIHHDGTAMDITQPGAFQQGTVAMTTFCVGKKAAGAVLDGREHKEWPRG